MPRRTIAALTTLLLGVGTLGCSGADEPLFLRRELPLPAWLTEKWSQLCVSRRDTPLTDALEDAKAPAVLTSGDAPCSTTSDSTGGGALFDFSGDGLPDIIWTTSVLGEPVFLQNAGDLEFVDVSEYVAPGVDLRYTNGIALGDVDRDGDTDMYLTASGRRDPVLLLNEGKGSFVDGTAASGLQDAFRVVANGTSALFGDYDDDGWLDLYTMEYRLLEIEKRGTPGNTRLFRNMGGEGRPGVFTDVTESAGVTMRQKNGALLTFTAAFHDLNADDLLDLLVVSDFNTSIVFLNNGDGTFRDGFEEVPITEDESGMGLAIGDMTGDGSADVFIVGASQIPAPRGDLRTCEDVDDTRTFARDGLTGNRLYSFDENVVRDVTDVYGVRHSGWGWGAVMTDFDLDARLDILTVGSRNVGISGFKTYCAYPDSDQAVVRLWRNTGTTTEEVSAPDGLTVSGRLKSPLAGDLDLDGDEDLVVFRSGDRPLLFENRSKERRHVSLAFSGEELYQNARVTVRFADGSTPLVRHVGLQTGLYAARHTDEVFGLGDRGTVESIVVEYRSGRSVTFEKPRDGDRLVAP